MAASGKRTRRLTMRVDVTKSYMEDNRDFRCCVSSLKRFEFPFVKQVKAEFEDLDGALTFKSSHPPDSTNSSQQPANAVQELSDVLPSSWSAETIKPLASESHSELDVLPVSQTDPELERYSSKDIKHRSRRASPRMPPTNFLTPTLLTPPLLAPPLNTDMFSVHKVASK